MGRRLLVGWLHLSVLWAFAVTQPLFGVLGEAPEFFVARDNTGGDIVLLAVALTIVPPTALMAIEFLLSPLALVRRLAHLSFVALLAAAFLLQLLEELSGGESAVLIALAFAIGAAMAVWYARGRAPRLTLTVLSPAPALFLAAFLFASPVSELVLPDEGVAARGAKAGGGPPLVMVVLDELSSASLLERGDRIDGERYPNFARLARGSTWYPNATTVADETTLAVPAVVSGSRPTSGAIPTAGDYPRNLFALLGNRYRISAHEPVTRLCAERLCGEIERASRGSRLTALWNDLSVVSLHLLLPEDLDRGLPTVDAAFEGFRGPGDGPGSDGFEAKGLAETTEDRAAEFTRFIEGIDGGGQRATLDFLHILLPHVPYEYLPSGRRYSAQGAIPPGVFSETWVDDPFLPQQGHQRYLLQLEFADELLGRLVARMKHEGLYDRSVLVVTADHGVSFRRGTSRRIVSEDNFPDIAGVPLFVKAPGQRRGRVNDSTARSVDILPTVAELLGVRLPWKVDGRSLVRADHRRTAISVLDRDGREVRVRLADFQRGRRADVIDRRRLVGRDGLFAFGPHAGLVGKELAQLRRGPAAAVRASLDESRLLTDVRPESAFVPAYVTGEIKAGLPAGRPLAIALNGTIATVVSTWADGGSVRFSAMLPPAGFRRGTNSLGLFAVNGSGAATSISRISDDIGDAPGGLTSRGGKVAIELSGRRLAVTDDAVTGFVERVTADDAAHLHALGWAADPRRRERVGLVLVFAGGRLVGSAVPARPRPDVARAFGRAGGLAGWDLRIAYPNAGSVARAPAERLRFFGVLGGHASELEYLKSGQG